MAQEVATDASCRRYPPVVATARVGSPPGYQTHWREEPMPTSSNSMLQVYSYWGTYSWCMQDDWYYKARNRCCWNNYAAGFTESASGIATGGHQTVYGGNTDLSAKFNDLGALLLAAYYGDTSIEDHPDLALYEMPMSIWLAKPRAPRILHSEAIKSNRRTMECHFGEVQFGGD